MAVEEIGILRCGLCNKPFDKQSTLKRHGYYCRAKRGNSRAVRSRSCVACAKVKKRCDDKFPSCTRCVTRNIECRPQNDSNSRKSSSGIARKELQRTRRPVREGSSESAASSSSQPPANINAGSAGNEYAAPNSNFTSLSEEQFDWDILGMDVLENQNIDDQPLYSGSLESTRPPQLTQSDESPTNREYQIGPSASAQTSSITRAPTYDLRSFTASPALKGGAKTTAIHMVHILTSYPMMMRNQGSFPPFIHPSFIPNIPDAEEKPLESLTTCASLMQMVSTGVQGSRKLFWKNVRLECERLQQECAGFDRWELLASLQALSIYMLVRLQEGETAYNNCDILVLSTTWVVACTLNQYIGNIPCERPSGLSYGTSRKDWIFEESRRRLGIVFKTMRMLFNLEPAMGCSIFDDFLLSPLPARKQLWQSLDEKLWMLEKSRDVNGESVFGVKGNGQMAKWGQYQAILSDDMAPKGPVRSSESTANWQEWCSGMDELGTLVILAASLPTS